LYVKTALESRKRQGTAILEEFKIQNLTLSNFDWQVLASCRMDVLKVAVTLEEQKVAFVTRPGALHYFRNQLHTLHLLLLALSNNGFSNQP
jgi:hypothetical protein